MAITQSVTTPQVPPLGAAGNTSPTPSASTTASGKISIAKTFDQFLTLLTTQLKNQDPLSPQDSSQFTSQLVQFSQVEQEINTNTKLDALIAAGQSNQLLQAASYIGKNVEISGNNVTFDGTHPVEFGYTPSGEVNSASIVIANSDGQIVRQAPVSLEPGHNLLNWDGSNATGGKVGPGNYTITLQALDRTGNPVPVSVSTIGKVSGVSQQDNQTMVTVGDGDPISISKIISVRS
jgi:flagellar basal-body rod modification protein FlgD